MKFAISVLFVCLLLPVQPEEIDRYTYCETCLTVAQESHHDQFYESLVNKELKNLDIALCYEQSNSCMGVKRQTFEDSKGTFTESDIDSLLRDNKENFRIAQPIHLGSPEHTGDEL